MTDPKDNGATEMAADGELSDDGLDQVSGGGRDDPLAFRKGPLFTYDAARVP
jgi:hypothetical protein